MQMRKAIPAFTARYITGDSLTLALLIVTTITAGVYAYFLRTTKLLTIKEMIIADTFPAGRDTTDSRLRSMLREAVKEQADRNAFADSTTGILPLKTETAKASFLLKVRSLASVPLSLSLI